MRARGVCYMVWDEKWVAQESKKERRNLGWVVIAVGAFMSEVQRPKSPPNQACTRHSTQPYTTAPYYRPTLPSRLLLEIACLARTRVVDPKSPLGIIIILASPSGQPPTPLNRHGALPDLDVLDFQSASEWLARRAPGVAAAGCEYTRRGREGIHFGGRA